MHRAQTCPRTRHTDIASSPSVAGTSHITGGGGGRAHSAAVSKRSEASSELTSVRRGVSRLRYNSYSRSSIDPYSHGSSTHASRGGISDATSAVSLGLCDG